MLLSRLLLFFVVVCLLFDVLRECGSPRPKYGGRKCEGSIHEEMFLTECATSVDLFEPVFGYWSDWSEWSCNVLCTGNETVNRHRLTILFNVSETALAPPFHGGQYCERDCYSCMDNCSRVSGECSRCNAGYKNPGKACKEVDLTVPNVTVDPRVHNVTVNPRVHNVTVDPTVHNVTVDPTVHNVTVDPTVHNVTEKTLTVHNVTVGPTVPTYTRPYSAQRYSGPQCTTLQ
ncbi:Hemicentin-1 [Bulinus truncatus]|nr:Hemicentin-1 [Bulinus truncatus]